MSNVDRTKLNALIPNLEVGQVAEPELRQVVFEEIYTLLEQRAAETDVLLKTNNTSFTPSANYHPSTKKYTDDAINAAIVSVVGTAIIQSGTAFPASPVEGQTFFNTNERRFYVYSLSAWNPPNSVADQIYAYKNFGGL